MNADWCKRVFLLFVPFVLLVPAAAQDTQRFEVFGGYSLLHDNLMLAPSTTTFNGWDAAPTLFFNRWFGITADFSGYYGAETIIIPATPQTTAGKIRLSAAQYTFMAGPHFTYHKSRYAPFAQALFGGYHQNITQETLVPVTCIDSGDEQGVLPTCSTGPTGGSGVARGFAMALGGGLDIAIGHGIFLRPIQADYVLRRSSTLLPNNGSFFTVTRNVNDFRYSIGIVFRFGPHVGKN
jgi:hypothetical protein